MKTLFTYILILAASCTNGQEQFDLVTYQPPVGWQKSSDENTMTFSNEDGGGNYCVMTVYKSIETVNDADNNFNISWESLVQNVLGTGAATMQPGSTDNSWENRIGSAPFEKDGLQGAAILITSSKGNKMINIMILTNTDKFQTEMETFLDGMTLIGETATETTTSSTTIETSMPSANKPELWANMRYVPKDYYDVTAGTKPISDFYVVYPNGDYLPNAPYEGLNDLNKSIQAESWGKFTMKGRKGKFKNNYGEIAVTKKTDSYLEKDGYAHGFHKCLSVDGARLEGFYTHVAPNWGKDSKLDYLDDAGCQFTIQFKKDGTFVDKGIFSSSLYNCSSGKGTYSVKNYTITFNYDDGRVVQRLFSAPPTRNIASYDETVYIGQTPYYKKQ